MHRLRTIGGGRSLIRRSAPRTGLSLHNLTNWEEACLGVHVLPFNHNHLRPDSDQKMTRKRNFRGQHLSFPGAPPECPLCHCHAFYISWFYFLNSKLDFSRSKWFWWFRLTSVAPSHHIWKRSFETWQVFFQIFLNIEIKGPGTCSQGSWETLKGSWSLLQNGQCRQEFPEEGESVLNLCQLHHLDPELVQSVYITLSPFVEQQWVFCTTRLCKLYLRPTTFH